MNQLIGRIAHEINNPLAIISEEAGWMQDILNRKDMIGISNYNELAESLIKITKQANLCKEITQNLGKYSLMDQLPDNLKDDINKPLAIISKEAWAMQNILCGKEMANISNYDELTNSLQEITKQADRCKSVADSIGGPEPKETGSYTQ